MVNFVSKGILREWYVTSVFVHGTFLAGLVFAIPSCLIPQLQQDGYEIDTFTLSFIGSSMTFLSSVMTIFIMISIGKFGRKTIQQICLVIAIICLSILILSESIIWICVGLLGASATVSFILPVVPAYISEMCQKERRGMFLATSFILFTSGNAVNFIFNLILSWRQMCAVHIVIAASGLLQTFFVPETPYWHLLNNEIKRAKQSLLWIQPQLSTTDLDQKIQNMKLSIEAETEKKFCKLFTYFRDKKVRKALFIGLILNLFRAGEGRSIFIIYFFSIFQSLNVPYDLRKWSAYYGVVYMICIVGIVVLTKKLNRKTSVYLWSFIMAVCLCIMIAYKCLYNFGFFLPPWTALISGYIYFLFSTSGLYSTTFTILTEIQVAYCRPEMTALLNGMACIFIGMYAYIFPYVQHFFDIQYVFLFFLVNLIMINVLINRLVPETSSFEFYDNMDKEKKKTALEA